MSLKYPMLTSLFLVAFVACSIWYCAQSFYRQQRRLEAGTRWADAANFGLTFPDGRKGQVGFRPDGVVVWREISETRK